MSWFLFRISPHIYFQVFVFNTWMLFLLLFFFSEQRSWIVTIFEYWSNISKSGKGCSFMISWIPSFLFVLTWDLLEDGHIDDIAIISNKILLFLSYKTNRFHVVMGLYRSHQNIVKTSVTHSAAPCVSLFCSYHILTSSVIFYWTDTHQHIWVETPAWHQQKCISWLPSTFKHIVNP